VILKAYVKRKRISSFLQDQISYHHEIIHILKLCNNVAHTLGDDDTSGRKELISMHCHTPAFVDNPSSAPPALIGNPSSGPEDHCVCSDSSTENFASDDDNNSNISEEQDDEYFIFASR
ncbi:hypothetical protein EJB05_37149, partial [Eragrostis curvula]